MNLTTDPASGRTSRKLCYAVCGRRAMDMKSASEKLCFLMRIDTHRYHNVWVPSLAGIRLVSVRELSCILLSHHSVHRERLRRRRRHASKNSRDHPFAARSCIVVPLVAAATTLTFPYVFSRVCPFLKISGQLSPSGFKSLCW